MIQPEDIACAREVRGALLYAAAIILAPGAAAFAALAIALGWTGLLAVIWGRL